jgi:hypothetical protein
MWAGRAHPAPFGQVALELLHGAWDEETRRWNWADVVLDGTPLKVLQQEEVLASPRGSTVPCGITVPCCGIPCRGTDVLGCAAVL